MMFVQVYSLIIRTVTHAYILHFSSESFKPSQATATNVTSQSTESSQSTATNEMSQSTATDDEISQLKSPIQGIGLQ